MQADPWIILDRLAQKQSYTEIGRRIGYSRSAVSTFHARKYPGDTRRIEAAILQCLSTVDCPHLGLEIAGDRCRSYRDRPYPTSSSVEAAHWRACKTCKAYQE